MILNDTVGKDMKGSRNGCFTVMSEHLFEPKFEPGYSAIQNINCYIMTFDYNLLK
jgi:hypothetical protein